MRLIVVSFLLLMMACNTREQAKQVSTAQSDTLTEPTINLGEERKEFIESYQAPFMIDTSFLWKDTVYTLRLKHFSSMDSGLTVPAKYNFDTNNEFVTHNFNSRFVLVKQGDTIVDKAITKATFSAKLTPELKAYGTLLFPNLRISNDTIEIGYSLVIPVTDVGIPVSIRFNINGSYEIAE